MVDGSIMQRSPADEPGLAEMLERTGDDAVDRVLDRLEGLPAEAQPAEQAAVLVAVCEQLQQRLTAADR